MATFFFKSGEYTWCVDGKIRGVMGQLTIDGDKYILHCRTTPQYAREKFYQMEHPYDFELDGADMPHDLRVWLVDFGHRIGKFTCDECTKSQAIIFINSHMLRWKDHMRELSEMIERRDPCLIEKRSKYWIQLKVQHEFEDDLPDEISIIQSPNKIKTTEKMPWEKYPEIYAEMMKEVENVKAEQTALELSDRTEQERMKREREQRQGELKRERESAVRDAINCLIDNIPGAAEDLERLDAGLMPDSDQHDYLRRRFIMIPDGFKLFSDIAPDEFCTCDYCDTPDEYDFEIIDATELTRAEYHDFKILTDTFAALTDTIYANENIQVMAKKETCYCDVCEHKLDKTFYQVEMKIGDFTVFRRIMRKEK